MDGVLWKDMSPIGDLPVIFDHIRKRDLKVVLATNNATSTIDEYLDKLIRLGVTLEPWQIVTSSEAIAHMLLKAYPQKGAVYVVGENGVISALCEKGFDPITDPNNETPVVAVVGGMDRTLTYQKLQRASSHIRAGVPFYGTNPDATFPTPAGLVPGAGSILAAIETAAEVKPVVIGKPSPYMFELSAERMGLSKDEILVVGDRLETDIAGGQGVGNRTALVLSGVSTRQQALDWTPPPDLIAIDLTELVAW
jgi:4-nitrophenyl phosphatase